MLEGKAQKKSEPIPEPPRHAEVVQTFNTYFRGMIAQAKAAGVTPIVSAQTPNNPFENSDTAINSPPRFVGYAKVCLHLNVTWGMC